WRSSAGKGRTHHFSARTPGQPWSACGGARSVLEKLYPPEVGARLTPWRSRALWRRKMASTELTGLLQYVRALAGTAAAGDRSDPDLLGQFVARRDEGAFAALLERHGPLVLGVCRQVLGDQQEAEDAFQATFLVLARKAATIHRQASLAAWLHRVALNLARTTLAAKARRRAHERQVARMVQATHAANEAPCDWQALVHEEVDRLAEKYRLPVVLCYLEGKTHGEAARALGWPLGTVKGRLARARDLLRT